MDLDALIEVLSFVDDGSWPRCDELGCTAPTMN
jgi:hypothetical protein